MFKRKIAFTLAEIMIVLTIIGVLTMILLPIANHSRPDENVMKFKKADTTLKNVIHELVTSDKYFCNGDLGLKADCTTKVANTEEMGSYFCKTFADLLSAKEVNCMGYNDSRTASNAIWLLSNEAYSSVPTGSAVKRTVTDDTIAATKNKFDTICKEAGKTVGKEIVTADGIVYYQAGKNQFGSTATGNFRYLSPPNQFPANYGDLDGFDISYKIYCIDVDGIPSNVTTTDCKNECPFGYGIRADGKILSGERADEWLEKGFQKGANDN